MTKVRHLRWWVAALLFGAAVLNYVDRQTLSALAPTIQHDLGFDDRAYADVVNLFLVAYTIAYLVAGRVADRIGTRSSAALFVAWWSLANMLTAAATGVRSLSAYRFLLGLGESGIWPVASKAVSEWFPARERALAIGFYTMGATIGATVAPYVVIPLAAYAYDAQLPWLAALLPNGTGWRLAFVLTGLTGLLWLVPWLFVYRLPRQSRLLHADELALIEAGSGEGDDAGTPWTWGQVFSSRVVWLLLLGRLLTDPVWYFFQFWFAKYLNTARGLEQSQLTITWVVYAAAGVGSVAGGWLSGVLIRRGGRPAPSRLRVMLACAALVPLSPLIATVHGLAPAMALTAVVVCASLAWLINISAIVVDVVPKHSLGTAFSVVAAGSTLGGIVMNTVVATMVSGPSSRPGGFLDQAIGAVFGPLLQLVQGAGYPAWFLAMAALHPLAWLMLWLGGVHRGSAPESAGARAA